jgi:hypothetical protein
MDGCKDKYMILQVKNRKKSFENQQTHHFCSLLVVFTTCTMSLPSPSPLHDSLPVTSRSAAGF